MKNYRKILVILLYFTLDLTCVCVCLCVGHMCLHGKKGQIWNLADKNDSDQGKIMKILEKLFHIKIVFHDSAITKSVVKVE
jgi:hypothetical protein